MAKLSKNMQNELISKEVDRLNSIFIDLTEAQRETAKELIERVAFMTVQLEILEEAIKAKGPTYLFKQGTQKMIVENPAQKSYNTMMNRYTTAYDKLFNLLAKMEENQDSDSDEFEDV